ncbi:MAG: LCP family protein [Leptolyngbyaceae cyanobacterium]
MNTPKRRHSARSSRPLPKQGSFQPSQRSGAWLAIGVCGAALLSATAGALLAMTMTSTPLMQRKLSASEASVFSKGDRILAGGGNLRLPGLTRPVNVLVLGVKVLTTDIANPPPNLTKLRYQALVNSFDGLTDTMLLLRFNPETKKISILSIPRDTKTEIPGHGVTKINAANVYGGPALTAKSISQLLDGVGIDRYVTINVQGVQALIDALGGVTVYVPKAMKYQDDSQHLYINLKAGKQHLNGEQALQMLRFRYEEYGDIGRIQRQQMVMRALMEQALNPATVARLPNILSVIQSYVDTNLSVEELVALVGYGSRTSRSDVQMLMLPGDFSSEGEYETSYWLPNYTQITSLMAQYFGVGTAFSQSLAPSSVKITLQNSTNRQQLAEALVSRLGQVGYTNVATMDQPLHEPLRTTRIVAQQGDEESAKAIQQALGFGEVWIENTGDLASDVTIQLGQDWAGTPSSRTAKPTNLQ